MTYYISDEDMDKLRKLAVDVTQWVLKTPKYTVDDECQEWRKIAERLAKYFIWVDGEYGIYTCIHCDTEGEYTGGIHQDVLEEQVIMTHAPDCPITLYRQLVEKYGYKPSSEVRILKDSD